MLGSSHGKDRSTGFFDELKDKAEEFGDKAKEGFGAANDKAEDAFDNVKDRFDGDDTVADQAKDAADSSTEPRRMLRMASRRRWPIPPNQRGQLRMTPERPRRSLDRMWEGSRP